MDNLEKLLLDLVGIANRTKAGQVTHKIEEIKALLAKQEAEYKEKCEKRISLNIQKLYQVNEKLKQQHKAQMEGLKQQIRTHSGVLCSANQGRVCWRCMQNEAIDEFNKKLDQMLQDSDK